MLRVQQALRAAGLLSDEEPPALSAARARLARVLRQRRAHRIGLAPAADDVAVPAPALEIARALAAMSPRPVAVMDALGTWPCARALADDADPDGMRMATSWLLDRLAVLTPRTLDSRANAAFVHRAIVDQAPAFDHLVVDLTGLDHTGEQVVAFDVLDVLILVARSGRTTTHQIERFIREVPAALQLGVLLTGL